jgi:hypothetical protein
MVAPQTGQRRGAIRLLTEEKTLLRIDIDNNLNLSPLRNLVHLREKCAKNVFSLSNRAAMLYLQKNLHYPLASYTIYIGLDRAKDATTKSLSQAFGKRSRSVTQQRSISRAERQSNQA